MKDAFVGESSGIRFNDLLRLSRKIIDPKIAAPTLSRHLKYLRKGRIVKRTRKGKQNVTYSLTAENPLISRDEIERVLELHEQFHKKASSLSLKEIVENVVFLSWLFELELIKIWVEKKFSKQKAENLSFKAEFLRTSFQVVSKALMAAADGKEAQYKETIRFIDEEISSFRQELFKKQK